MKRIDELWRDVGGPGKAPGISVRAVKDRVNATLDADPKERKVYMKQKLRFALVAAALAAAVTGSALAASENWDMLSLFFKGDTSPAQEYVNNTVYSVHDENFTFTVESSVSDESVLYVIATVTALNEEAKEALFDPHFQQLGTFEFYIPAWDQQWKAMKQAGGEAPEITAYGGFGGGEIKIQSEDTRKFQLHANLFGEPDEVELWLGQMGREYSMTIPICPAPTRVIELNVSGTGIHDSDATPGPLFIRRVSLSPFSFQMETTGSSTLAIIPRFLFRMADGSIRTQAQIMEFREGWAAKMRSGTGSADYVQIYRFHEVQNLDEIVSILIFDMEYPLDGSQPFPVEHDPSLDPFFVRKMTPLSEDHGYPVPVRELTEKLGGICHWDPATGDVTCVYRDTSIVLRPGVDVAVVNGEPVTMWDAPAVQGGSLAASWGVFRDAWSLDGFVTYTRGERLPDPDDPGSFITPTFYHDWYITP